MDIAKSKEIETLVVPGACIDAVDREKDGPREEPYRDKETGHEAKEANEKVRV